MNRQREGPSGEALEEKATCAESRALAARHRADFARERGQLAVSLAARDSWAREEVRHRGASEAEARRATDYRRQATSAQAAAG